MTWSFATIRFFAVMRQTLKAPLLVRFPQKCVNPRNVKVSGFPWPRCLGFERRTARTRSDASCPDVIPDRTLPTGPEILTGTARRQLGVESPQQDRRHNARQLHRRVRLSCARPQPTGRTHSAGTRSQAVVKPLLPEEYLLSSPTTDHLPILRPLTISGSGEACGDRPLDAR